MLDKRAFTGHELVPLTYVPPSMQVQFEANRVNVEGKPYSRFFTPDLSVPVEWAKALQHGELSADLTLTPSVADLNTFIAEPRRFPDAGYAVLDGTCCYAQSRIEMAGVDAEMFRWWFRWHPIERQRYMLWFPHAHIDNFVADPQRLADTSLSYEQRLYGNPNFVNEFIGPTSLEIIIHFTDPVELGLDRAGLTKAGFSAAACGTIRTAAAPDTTFMLMLHLARDTENGLELFSRYWIGAHAEFQRFPGGADAPALLDRMGMDAVAIGRLAYEMSVHDMTEFNQLARILPELHGEFGS